MRQIKIVISVIVLLGITAMIYTTVNKPKYCSEHLIDLRADQVVRANVLPVISSKRLDTILGSVSSGRYTVYGDFRSCKVPKMFDGYSAVFSTWHNDIFQTFQVSGFLVDRYQDKYQYLLDQGVQQNQKLLVREKSLFWKNGDVYYVIQGRPDLIKALVEARIFD